MQKVAATLVVNKKTYSLRLVANSFLVKGFALAISYQLSAQLEEALNLS
jgi:hypothetical protein